MKQDVNYIKHHKGVNEVMAVKNLNASHISLYNALFLIWNNCGFDTDLSINRNDVMKLSKIGSANTYTKCLKDLDREGLLKYNPSFNPLIGSKINLYRFDKGTDKGSDKGIGAGSGNGSDNSTASLSKQVNKETIKLINNNATLLNQKLKDWIDAEPKDEPTGLTPTQKVLEFVESDYDVNLVAGFKRFIEFVEKTKHVKNIPSQINIASYQKICDEHTVDKLKQKITELDNWLDDPNTDKAKKKKKSLPHLMNNTWLKNGY